MRRSIYILGLCIASFVSCTEMVSTGDHISLKANVYSAEADTRASVTADPYEGNTPSEAMPLTTSVWFSYDKQEFLHEPTEPTYIPCRTSVTFKSNAATYVSTAISGSTEYLKYPTDNSTVYCVGFYPGTDTDTDTDTDTWTTTDGTKVSHTIDGTKDLMFADVISGTWNSPFESQQYNHLLTWIKVSVCAMTKETAEHWGKIKKISISSKTSVSINLAAGTAAERIQYSDESQSIVSYEDENGLELSLTSKEAGSLFCSPATEYTVTIETSKGGTKEVTIPLADLNYNRLTDPAQATGKLFILSLYFTPFNIIEGSCTLNYWNDQSEDLYLHN